MPAATLLRQHSRTLLLVTTVPLALAAAVVDDVRVRRQLEAARRDPLTGLPGRDGLAAHATKALASRRRHQQLLVMCDGNGFKAINDRFGHAAGDQVVITLAHRLRQWATGHRGVAARLGGDEFAALVHLPRHAAERELTALRAHMNRPVPHQDLQLPFTVSIGAAHTTCPATTTAPSYMPPTSPAISAVAGRSLVREPRSVLPSTAMARRPETGC
ncbi:GGDEF domain-containing protein [Actinacidiphila glaucinigra]